MDLEDCVLCGFPLTGKSTQAQDLVIGRQAAIWVGRRTQYPLEIGRSSCISGLQSENVYLLWGEGPSCARNSSASAHSPVCVALNAMTSHAPDQDFSGRAELNRLEGLGKGPGRPSRAQPQVRF